MDNSYNIVSKNFLELEEEYELFSLTIEGVWIWEIIRYKLYTIKVNSQSIVNKDTKNAFFIKIKRMIKKKERIINFIFHNPYYNLQKENALIFQSSRKVRLNNDFIDPYTYYLSKEIESQGISYATFQSSYYYDKYSLKDKRTFHLDFILLTTLFLSKLAPVYLKKDDRQKIINLQLLLKNKLDIKTDLVKTIKNEIAVFKISSWFYRKLFKYKRPHQIYIVNFCDKPAIISEAKKQNIEVIDIQHGIIATQDLIYHYPNVFEGSLKYFPDKFYSWSAIWSKICKLPITNENIIAYGNKYLLNQSIKYSETIKNRNQIVIASQDTLTKEIAQYVIKNINDLSEYEIFYKLHPNEYSYFFNLKEYEELRKHSNVIFLDRHIDLYDLLAKSYYFIGVYTAMIIEAIHFNCKVLLIDLPGVEMMNPFIDGDRVMVIAGHSLFKILNTTNSH